MPIFHDPDDSPPRQPSSHQTSSSERQRAASPITEIHVSQLDDLNFWGSTGLGTQPNMNTALYGSGRKQQNVDRVELIERLKRTKSPVWQQSQEVRHPPLPTVGTGIPQYMYIYMLQLLIQHRSSAPKIIAQNHDRILEIARQALYYLTPNSGLRALLRQIPFEN